MLSNYSLKYMIILNRSLKDQTLPIINKERVTNTLKYNISHSIKYIASRFYPQLLAGI